MARRHGMAGVLLVSIAAGLGAQPPYPNKAKLLEYRDDSGVHAIKTAADWAKRRDHILAHMQAVMGNLPDAKRPKAAGRAWLEARIGLYCRWTFI